MGFTASKDWENFEPKRIPNVEVYSTKDVANVFGISRVYAWGILSGRAIYHNEILNKKVREFAKSVGYNAKIAAATGDAKKRGFSSIEQRDEHIRKLREMGYSNAEIAKLSGYSISQIFNLIGAQPVEITQRSNARRGKITTMKAQDRKAVEAELKRKREVEEANAKVEEYHAALDKLTALDEELAMLKMKYVSAKAETKKLRKAIPKCATAPIRELAQQIPMNMEH